MLDLRMSVYTRALLFIAVMCVALVGLDLEQSWATRSARLAQAQMETGTLARSLTQHVQDVFENTDTMLKGLRDAIVADGIEPAAIRRLDRRMHVLVENQRILHGVAVYDEKGDWLATSLDLADFEKVRNFNYAERDFFRYHRDHTDDDILIGSPIQSKLDGAWVVTVSRRLFHPDGSFAGVVQAAITIDVFQTFFGTFDTGNHFAITLVSRQGVVIVRSPFEGTNIGRNITQSEFFRTAQRSSGAGGREFISLLDGKARLGSFRKVGDFDLIMMVALDTDEVLAGWWHETKIHLVWLAMSVCFMAILGYRLTIQIRDRVAAENVANKLKFDTDQLRASEAERRAYQRELEQQQLELERSNADLERFAYAASHDLQSPLRAIAHLGEWIGQDVGESAGPDTIEHLALLKGRIARMQMLIGGLLAYARVGRPGGAVEDLDVAAVVRDVAGMMESRPNFVIACKGDMFPIRTHRAPFELIMKNLITNAVQHHDRAEGRVTVCMRLADGMAEFRVSDDGPGIAEAFHEKIFIIFQTLQSRDDLESGGLGLAMVRKQVTDNGGRIWVESAPPVRGTTFVFTWKPAPA